MTIQLMIPLDGSHFAEQAIGYATELAAHTPMVIHLVKVHQSNGDEPLGDARFMTGTQLEEELREEDRHYLAKVASAPALAGQTLVTALLNGAIAPALQKYIRSCGIDLVIMSTHGRGGLSRAWFGSVADDLVRNANVPVLLLRPEGDHPTKAHPVTGIHNILLPLDGSEFSESLIETAASIGGVDETRYTLLQVVPAVPAVTFADGIGVVTTPDLTAELRADAAMHLEQVASRLRGRGLRVETAVISHGDVASAIRTFAIEHDIDLIAMVTHGRSGWKRLALGSVADMVLRGTAVPLLVLHPNTAAVHLGNGDVQGIDARLATCG